jgi:hypothetical protein
VRREHHLLGRDLRIGVRRAGGLDRPCLVHPVRVVEAVYDDRGKVDEAARPGADGGLDHVARPDRVDPPKPLVLAAEAHDRRRVNHQLRAGRLLLPRTRLADVALDDVELRVGPHVDAAHL